MSLSSTEENSGEATVPTLALASEMLYFGPILVIVLLFTIAGTRFSYQKQQTYAVISARMLFVVRVWSTILLVMYFGGEIIGDRISLPHMSLAIALGGSGLLADQCLSQTIFHVASTCSWFGIFDMYVRSPADMDIFSYFTPGWLIAYFIATAPILRVHMGCYWQIHNVAYMSVGLIFLLSYFWGIEFTSCTYLKSTELCDYMGKVPSKFSTAYYNYDYRIIGMMIAVTLHITTALLLYAFVPNDNHKHNIHASSASLPTVSKGNKSVICAVSMNTPSSSSNTNGSSTASSSTSASSISAATATDWGGFPSTRKDITGTSNGSISGNNIFSAAANENAKAVVGSDCYQYNSVGFHSQQQLQQRCVGQGQGQSQVHGGGGTGKVNLTLPDDCVQITEAEAIRIVERGLRSIKTKRAN